METDASKQHFMYIFWFIVGLCIFGAAFTVFLVVYMPPEEAKRVADTALIFWLSTAVAGGIGYLIGNSAAMAKKAENETTLTTPDNGGKTTIIKEQ
jgi:hypothetical protein